MFHVKQNTKEGVMSASNSVSGDLLMAVGVSKLASEAYRCWAYLCAECSSAYLSNYMGMSNEDRARLVRLRNRAYLRVCRRVAAARKFDKKDCL